MNQVARAFAFIFDYAFDNFFCNFQTVQTTE